MQQCACKSCGIFLFQNLGKLIVVVNVAGKAEREEDEKRRRQRQKEGYQELGKEYSVVIIQMMIRFQVY